MRFLMVLLSFALIPFSHAAQLKGTNGVEILAVDGKSVQTKMLESKEINVADGSHQIVVKYAKMIKSSGMVYSKPHIFSVDIKGDTVITIRSFNSKTQAEYAVRKGLTWIVKNEQGTQKIAGSDIIFKEGVQIKPDIEKLIAEYNFDHGIGEAAQQEKTAQLIKLYRSATKEERKAFRMWLLEHDIK